MEDHELNARLAALLGRDAILEKDRVLVGDEVFDPVHDNRQCDPLTDRFGIDLSWSEGLWCAQATSPSGREVEIEDTVATRAVVRAILHAFGQESAV